MNDKSLALAYSVYANPGVYALLLGSGVSCSAGIKTGWEMVVDMCQRLALLEGEGSMTDPAHWYKKKYGIEPQYDKLLEKLGQTPDERQAILYNYFTPSEQERKKGLKQPTTAHKQIAQLVKKGYVRMILTTNFDRLIEQALTEAGIDYDVAWNDDGLRGMRPYVHSNCTVLKLHGDFKDTRIKNTREELARYSELQNALLDRILDEFGLIIAGWSGRWDKALRAAMLRTKSERYSWYWLTKECAQGTTADVMEHRKVSLLPIDTADAFFTRLCAQIETLERYNN